MTKKSSFAIAGLGLMCGSLLLAPLAVNAADPDSATPAPAPAPQKQPSLAEKHADLKGASFDVFVGESYGLDKVLPLGVIEGLGGDFTSVTWEDDTTDAKTAETVGENQAVNVKVTFSDNSTLKVSGSVNVKENDKSVLKSVFEKYKAAFKKAKEAGKLTDSQANTMQTTIDRVQANRIDNVNATKAKIDKTIENLSGYINRYPEIFGEDAKIDVDAIKKEVAEAQKKAEEEAQKKAEEEAKAKKEADAKEADKPKENKANESKHADKIINTGSATDVVLTGTGVTMALTAAGVALKRHF